MYYSEGDSSAGIGGEGSAKSVIMSICSVQQVKWDTYRNVRSLECQPAALLPPSLFLVRPSTLQ